MLWVCEFTIAFNVSYLMSLSVVAQILLSAEWERHED